MKVVGTGAPRTITVRVQPCEIAMWREALRRRMITAADPTRRVPPPATEDEPIHRVEASAVARLLTRAHAAVAPGQPWVLTGPSWLLDDVIHSVTRAAVDRYAEAWRAFEDAPDVLNADRLRVALDTASACTATAMALARVQSDATD